MSEEGAAARAATMPHPRSIGQRRSDDVLAGRLEGAG